MTVGVAGRDGEGPGSDAAATDLSIVHLPACLAGDRHFDAAWCVIDGIAIPHSRVRESICCLADGVIGTRGTLEEDPEPDIAPVFAAGLYEPDPAVGERQMVLPSWVHLPLLENLPVGRLTLDLRDGLLVREVILGNGVLRTARFASAELPGIGVLVAEISPGLLVEDALTEGPTSFLLECHSDLGGGAALAFQTTCGSVAATDGLLPVQRMAAYVTSRARRPSHNSASTTLSKGLGIGAAGLFERQRTIWNARWAEADIEVVGDIESTRALRTGVFHLLGAVRRTGEAAVPARGLSGPAYAGHVFWDCEAFVLPVLAAIDSRAARAVLEYRIRRLEPARRRAARDGRSGARFPWESGGSGEDVTPSSGIDQNGNTVAIYTGSLEEHITAIIPWAAWRYATWHGGWSFLRGPGRPLVVDTARYWASRIRHDPSNGAAHIDHVIGPDEYHERVDDNAFTNLMAKWNLTRAAELVERTGGDLDEAAQWRTAADAIVDNYCADTGLYEQFAGYDSLEPLVVTALGEPPVAADLVLGAQRLQASQIIKQADTLMAHFLIPEAMAPGSLIPNLDHYLPRTAHGSSLSPAVHAALLARAGRAEEALELFRIACAIDSGDLTGTTAGGLHFANLGGIWQAVVHGFAGLSVSSPSDRHLTMAPVLPESWSELRFRLRWRGARLSVACQSDSVFVGCDRPVFVDVHGTRERVDPPGRKVG